MKGILRVAAGVVGAWLLAGCASLPADRAAPTDGSAAAATATAAAMRDRASDSTPDARFAAALRACRFLRGERPGNGQLDATRDDRLRDCLARRGWQPDGTPTLASLVGPQGEVMPSASATKAH